MTTTDSTELTGDTEVVITVTARAVDKVLEIRAAEPKFPVGLCKALPAPA